MFDMIRETELLAEIELRFEYELTDVSEAEQVWRDLVCEIAGADMLDAYPEPTILVG